MRGILINPRERTITEVNSDTGFTLDEMYALVNCGTIDVVSLDQDLKIIMVVDDEGFMYPNNAVFHIAGGTFAGNALLLGVTDEGENTDFIYKKLIVEMAVRWEDRVSSGEFGPTTEVRRNNGEFEIRMGKPILKEKEPCPT
jgi:hypothetical protein